MPLNPGTRLGSYEIVSPLGSGGMGEVYKAKDLKLGRDVAIKVLREDLASDPERLRRFEQEARAASSLNHPNIVTIYDIGEHEGTRYIAMEYVEGKTLREMLGGEPLPTKKLLKLSTQIADGLAKAHAAGIVHRDLKPENLMVTGDGFVKILDFGLAKLMPQPSQLDSRMSTRTKAGTREGVIVGTVQYMSPEQAAGRPVDHRSDQFSFGLILYEMVTGKLAFKRETVPQTQAAIIAEEPESVARLNPQLPTPVRWIIERCLAKEPEERYGTTGDLARELQNVRDHLSEVPSEPVAQPSVLPRRTAILSLVGFVIVLTVVMIGLNVGGLRERLIGGDTPERIESIAVLPLDNLSGDPEQEYFVDGMTEALIAHLAKIGALKVISRRSAMRYKGSDKPLPEIARELNVDALIEGSVLRVGDRVRITAQLIEAATDQHLWAESYERELEDILFLQREVARAITSEIQVEMTADETKRLVDARSVDPQAHNAYLRGRYHWNKRIAADMRRGMDYFRQAADIDPGYAPAYAGLADAWNALGWYSVETPRDAYPKARAAALRALAIDGGLAEAHISLAGIAMRFDWDWSEAEREFQRALELHPGYASGHHFYGAYLSAMGRHDEAIAEATRALELDPFALIVNTWLGMDFYFARQNDRALQQLRTTAELDPDFGPLQWHLGWLYEKEGMYSEALGAYQKAVDLSGRSPLYLASLAQALALTGAREQAQNLLDELRELAERQYVPAYQIAMIYMRLGQEELCFEYLEKAYEERSPRLSLINVEPRLDPLRDDPRFQDLLRRMNFPES